jgi:hypothetical protein
MKNKENGFQEFGFLETNKALASSQIFPLIYTGIKQINIIQGHKISINGVKQSITPRNISIFWAETKYLGWCIEAAIQTN